jgi:hypothetical protein
VHFTSTLNTLVSAHNESALLKSTQAHLTSLTLSPELRDEMLSLLEIMGPGEAFDDELARRLAQDDPLADAQEYLDALDVDYETRAELQWELDRIGPGRRWDEIVMRKLRELGV